MNTTPGPWNAHKYPDCTTWTVAGNESVASRIRNESDARLIAAAPELLEACKLAASYFDQWADTPQSESLRAAIAKATSV